MILENQPKITLYNINTGRFVPHPVEFLTFHGGEPHCKLDVDSIRSANLLIDARIGSMEHWGHLMVLIDALHRFPTSSITLFLPYFPGARQDRSRPFSGDPLTANMYAMQLNNYDLGRVFIVDPHSDVSPALINNVDVFTLADVLRAADRRVKVKGFYDALVCPDAGAEKRTYAAADALGIENVIHARKHRNMQTGEMTGADVDDFNPIWKLLVVDDICDGGRTFTNLYVEIENKGPARLVDLFVTHGIFSAPAGVGALSDFRMVISTDSFPGPVPQSQIPLLPCLGEALLERLI